jgi:hypothetical protein
MAFAELFSEMSVRVYDKETSEIVGVKPVPLSLTPKEKIASIMKRSDVNDVDPQFDNYLPRISIAMNGIGWDPERMHGKYERRLINIEYDDNGVKRTMQTDLQPVPYNLNFEVVIWAKYMTDGVQITENILPWFAPECHVSFKERNFAIEHKAKVTLNSITPNFVYEMGEGDRRVLQWVLNFNMETVMYKPMELTKEITCSIISIAGVPCKKSKFQGSNISIYEPITGVQESLFTKKPSVSVFDIDDSEGYDLMIKYWKIANNTMDAPKNIQCVAQNCLTDPGPQATYDPSISGGPCEDPLLKPVVQIDCTNGNIINSWQELITGPDNVIRVVSYQRFYDKNGADICGPIEIPNWQYPTPYIPCVGPEETYRRLLEDGDLRLTEDDNIRVLENNISINIPCEVPQETFYRLLEDGEYRLTEDDDTRTLEN